MSDDLFRPVLGDGSTPAAASEKVAADIFAHLAERSRRHGAEDPFAVSHGLLLGVARYLAEAHGASFALGAVGGYANQLRKVIETGDPVLFDGVKH